MKSNGDSWRRKNSEDSKNSRNKKRSSRNSSSSSRDGRVDDDDEDDRKPAARPSGLSTSNLSSRPPPDTDNHSPCHASVGEHTATGSYAGSSISTLHQYPPINNQMTALQQKLMTVDEDDNGYALTTLDNNKNDDNENSQNSNGLLTPDIVLVSGVSISTFVSFLCAVFSATALTSMAIFFSSLAVLMYLFYTRLLYLWNRMLEGRGIGDYLPPSLYRMLAEESFHEFMSSGNTMIEYRYLLLYFLPGLTADEVAQYIERLAPQHQHTLMRPGLAQFTNSDYLMTLIMGRQRWRSSESETVGGRRGGTVSTIGSERGISRSRSSRGGNNQLMVTSGEAEAAVQVASREAPAVEVIVENNFMTNRSRGIIHRDDDSDDDHSDLGLNVTENDMAGGLSNAEAERMARSLRLTTSTRALEVMNTVPRSRSNAIADAIVASSNNIDDDDDDDSTFDYFAEEAMVITEAFWDAVHVTIWPIYNLVRTRVHQLTRPLTGRIFRIGSTLTLFSGGFALLGYFGNSSQGRQIMNANVSPAVGRMMENVSPAVDTLVARSMATLARIEYRPSERFVWASALVGGAMAGTAMTLHYFMQPPPPRRRSSLVRGIPRAKSWRDNK